MSLPVSIIGVTSGINWENNLNAALGIIDQHNHTPGQGVQIPPAGLNINSDLPFGSNNATQLRTTRYSPQNSCIANSGSDIGEIYVCGNELYYNDVTGGHQVQLTSAGSVNATSSGISSGTASAAFATGTLVVKSSSTSFANTDVQSIILANSGNLSNQLTLQAPSLSGSYPITLPPIPSAQSFVALDTSGNLTGYANVSQGITRTMQAAVGQQISSSSGSFSTTSGTMTSVTNLSVSITTTGRPVILMLVDDGSGSVSSIGYCNPNGGTSAAAGLFGFFRGASQLTNSEYYSNGLTNGSTCIFAPASSIMYIDIPSAGTYTYSLKVSIGANPGTVYVNFVKLVAYEL